MPTAKRKPTPKSAAAAKKPTAKSTGTGSARKPAAQKEPRAGSVPAAERKPPPPRAAAIDWTHAEGHLIEVPVHWLRPATYGSAVDGERINTRTVFVGLDELRDSILAEGQMEPVRVRVPADAPDPGAWTEEDHPDIELVDGERRSRALAGTGMMIRARARVYSDAEVLQVVRVTGEKDNLSRLDLARTWQREMAQLGIGPVEYAARIGKDVAVISNATRLLALPARMQALINAGHVPQSAARDFILPFAHLREDLAAVLFGEIAARLEEEVGNETETVLGKRRVQVLAAAVAARMSAPVASGTGAGHDIQPVFNASETPPPQGTVVRFQYYDSVAAHERCFDLAWYDEANQAARARKREEAARLQAEQRAAAAREVESFLHRGRSSTPTVHHDVEHPAGQAGTGAEGGPDTSRAGAALPAPAPLPDYRPGQVLTPAERRLYDRDASWIKLGEIGAAGPSAGDVVADGVPGESVRYVESSHAGTVAVLCADPEAAAQGQAAASALREEMEERARRDVSHALREEAAAVQVGKPAALAAVLSAIGRAGGPGWLPALAAQMGMDLPAASPMDLLPALLAKLEKKGGGKEVEILFGAVAMLAEKGDFSRPYDAREEVDRLATARTAEACTASLAALLTRVPSPVLAPGVVAAQHTSRLEAALRRASAGTANPRMVREAAADFAARVDALREAEQAAASFLFGEGSAGPPGNAYPALADLADQALAFLQFTPEVIQLMGPAGRGAHLAGILADAVSAVAAARAEGLSATGTRGDAGEHLAYVRGLAADLAGEDPPEQVAAGIAEADAVLADLDGMEPSVFGGFQAPEHGAPAQEDGPSVELAARVGRLREALVQAENVGMEQEDELAALALLRRRYDEVAGFVNAHETAEYSVGDRTTVEEAEERLMRAEGVEG